MGLIIYDMNQYVKTQLPAPYTNIDIFPLVGYVDIDPPFMLYNWLPSKMNVERFYLRKDYITYTVYDTNADRLFDITNEMEKILNLADTMQGEVPSANNRVLWCDWHGGTSSPPIMIEGFYKMAFEICVGYVPLA